jgi:hypothetical protein
MLMGGIIIENDFIQDAFGTREQDCLRNIGKLLRRRAALPLIVVWPIRVGAIAAAILVSGGFFAVAHVPSLRILLYAGTFLVAATTLTVGIGLIR